MAGVALIIAKDGAPVAADRVADLARRMAYRGSRLNHVHCGHAGLAVVGHHERDSIGTSARWQVALAGRIDNRVDLASELGLPSPPADGSSDASVVAAALERWDADAAARLLGDFAIAALDDNASRALLIRDARGLQPLYFWDRGNELLCASDLQALAREHAAPVNEGMVAEWLTGSPSSHTETIYGGICRLPMAHLLELSRGSTPKRRHYWTPSADFSLTNRSDEDRAGAFAETLTAAVKARVEGCSKTALWLSGGLDSSSIAAVLSDEFRGSWRCFTLIDPASGIDERDFAEAVARSLGAQHTILHAGAVDGADIAAEITATLDVPSPPNGLQSMASRQQAVADGFGVALSGLGSDEWFGGSFLSYADLARSGRYVELMQTVWADRHREESTRVRLQIAAWSLCPSWLQARVRSAMGRSATPPWISRRLARLTSLDDRLRSREIASPGFELLSQQAVYEDNTRGGYVAGIEMQERANAVCGLDERYPFHDRRMIELSLSLPETDRWSNGQYKGVIRRAMAARLPRVVIERQDSPNADALVAATLDRLGGRRFFERLDIANRDWIDAAAVLTLWDRHLRRGRTGVEVWQLWAIAAVELWSLHAAARSSPFPGATTSVA